MDQIRGGPLESLSRAHGPAQDSPSVLDSQMLSHKRVLGPNIVIECDSGKWLDIGVRRGCGLAIAKEGRDNDEIFLWVQSMFLTDQPFVVLDRS